MWRVSCLWCKTYGGIRPKKPGVELLERELRACRQCKRSAQTHHLPHHRAQMSHFDTPSTRRMPPPSSSCFLSSSSIVAVPREEAHETNFSLDSFFSHNMTRNANQCQTHHTQQGPVPTRTSTTKFPLRRIPQRISVGRGKCLRDCRPD